VLERDPGEPFSEGLTLQPRWHLVDRDAQHLSHGDAEALAFQRNRDRPETIDLRLEPCRVRPGRHDQRKRPSPLRLPPEASSEGSPLFVGNGSRRPSRDRVPPRVHAGSLRPRRRPAPYPIGKGRSLLVGRRPGCQFRRRGTAVRSRRCPIVDDGGGGQASIPRGDPSSKGVVLGFTDAAKSATAGWRKQGAAVHAALRVAHLGLGGFGGGEIVPAGAMLGETSGGGFPAPTLLMLFSFRSVRRGSAPGDRQVPASGLGPCQRPSLTGSRPCRTSDTPLPG
jgi:hypothetical protein